MTPAIVAATGGDPHTTLAMELGALLEGGSLSGPWGVGDSGTSFGPFQIHLPAHPDVNAAQAADPGFAASFMAPAYQAAAQQVPGSLWDTNPEAAAEQTAFLAERPAKDYYASRGAATVNANYSAAAAALGGAPAGTGPGGMPIGLPSPGDALGAVAGFVDQFNPFSLASNFATSVGQDIVQGLFRLAAFGTLLAAGGALIAMGAWRSVSPQTKQTVTTAGLAAAA